MNKKIKYLLMFFTCFCIFSTDVNAIEFYWEDRIYYNKELGFSDKYKKGSYNHSSLFKKYKNLQGAEKLGAEPSGNAYCADRKKDYKSDSNYKRDYTYDDAKCNYEVYNTSKNQWEIKNGGDCSSIIGYIIKNAQDSTTNAFKKYGYAQSSIWTFLGKFSTEKSWKEANNKNVETAFAKNDAIRTILRNAFIQYEDDKNAGKTTTITKQENLFNINSYDKLFYFIPNYSKCGAEGGVYKTKTMTISNPSTTDSITVKIEPQDSGFDVVVTDSTGNEKCNDSTGCEIEVRANNSINFYLKTNVSENIGNVNLLIRAEKQGNTKTETFKIYDSIKYQRKNTKQNTNLQGLIIQTQRNVKGTEINKLYDDITLDFNQETMTFKVEKDNNAKTEGKSVCANIAENYEETHAELYATECNTITLNDNSKVRVILGETVSFDYGYLYPSNYDSTTNKLPIVYSGGSFKFNTDDSLGLTSKYKVRIGWEFADYKNGIPYYYNENTSDTNATTKIAEINAKLESIIKSKLENLELNIDTLDSNYLDDNGNGKKATYEYKINIYEDSQKITFNNGTTNELKFKEVIKNQKYNLSIDVIGIELKKYKMKENENGIVEYLNSNNEEYKRAYFVPMYYQEDTFKFNITSTDLSLIENFELNYNAECNIGVKNQFNQGSLRYRNISVSDPFPKANTNTGEGMPLNWKNWYVNNTKNQQRIANSYKNQFIYHINLTNEIIEKIDEINSESSYTDWKNINTSNGTSKVIIGENYNLFDKRASNNSYCKIGEFKDECDK